MRLGAPLLDAYETPEEWAGLVLADGYGSAYCPVGHDSEPAEVERYARQQRERAGGIRRTRTAASTSRRNPSSSASGWAYS